MTTANIWNSLVTHMRFKYYKMLTLKLVKKIPENNHRNRIRFYDSE